MSLVEVDKSKKILRTHPHQIVRTRASSTKSCRGGWLSLLPSTRVNIVLTSNGEPREINDGERPPRTIRPNDAVFCDRSSPRCCFASPRSSTWIQHRTEEEREKGLLDKRDSYTTELKIDASGQPSSNAIDLGKKINKTFAFKYRGSYVQKCTHIVDSTRRELRSPNDI